jgi:hypothetical protein
MQHNPVTDYLDALTRELNFDGKLAQRVRKEAEDHLWAAAACHPDGATLEAQQRAVANFGDPREIARRYAPLSLHGQAQRISNGVILALGVVFALMLARVAWYAFLQPGTSNELQGIRTVGLLAIRYSFFFALAGGTVSWVYVATRRIPAEPNGAFRIQLNVGLLLSGATAGAVFVSTTVGAALTALRLLEMHGLAAGLVASLLMLAELSVVGVLLYELHETIRRAARVQSLF